MTLDPTAWIAWLTAFTGTLTALVIALGLLVAAVTRLKRQLNDLKRESLRRDDATDKNVESVAWSMLRRGRLEAERKGLVKETASPCSPKKEEPVVTIRPDVVQAYAPILPTLKQIADANPGVTRAGFALLVEQKLGEWLSKHICRVYGVEEHACWDIAAELVLNEESTSVSQFTPVAT